MDIVQAVELALKKDLFIRRKSTLFSGTRIKPTNTYDACLVLVDGEIKRQSRFWNPTADDLVADDWEVVTE